MFFGSLVIGEEINSNFMFFDNFLDMQCIKVNCTIASRPSTPTFQHNLHLGARILPVPLLSIA